MYDCGGSESEEFTLCNVRKAGHAECKISFSMFEYYEYHLE